MALGAMAQQVNEDGADLESALVRAIKLRAPYLKGKAQNLTLSSVRRLLERDLSLKDFQLEKHKALIKGLVGKVFNETDSESENMDAEKPRKRLKKKARIVEDLDDGDLETHHTIDGNSDDVLEKGGDSNKETPTESNVDDLEDNLTTEKLGETDAAMLDAQGSDVEKPAVSPGGEEVLSEEQGAVQEGPSISDKEEVPAKAGETEETPVKRPEETTDGEDKTDQEPSQSLLRNTDENTIKLALSKRADELKSQTESLTLTSVRHLLEEDLGLARDGLKAQKQFIRTLVDELLAPPNKETGIEVEEAQVSSEGRPKKLESKSPRIKKSTRSEEMGESEEYRHRNGEVSDSVSEEKKTVKVQKKRKKKETEAKTKATVQVKKSADVKRPSSAKVERLRDILKFVGVGVPPVVYKKAKQVPEDEREEVLIKELERRLAQEGLSPNPSEKDMKRVKTSLEQKRDLDGIERSNIVQEPRRSRASANSWFAPRPNKYAQVAEKDSEDQDSDDDAKPIVTGAMDD